MKSAVANLGGGILKGQQVLMWFASLFCPLFTSATAVQNSIYLQRPFWLGNRLLFDGSVLCLEIWDVVRQFKHQTSIQERNVTQKKQPIQCVQFAHPSKLSSVIGSSFWVAFRFWSNVWCLNCLFTKESCLAVQSAVLSLWLQTESQWCLWIWLLPRTVTGVDSDTMQKRPIVGEEKILAKECGKQAKEKEVLLWTSKTPRENIADLPLHLATA